MKSLEIYLKEQNKPELTIIINSIVKSGIEIYKNLNLLPINGCYLDSQESINTSGDKPKKIDIYSHEILVEELKKTNLVSKIASEESDNLINCSDFISNKVYDVYFDPLDGSSNLECCGGTGTVFCIFPASEETFKKGTEIVCSGYLLYSSSLVLVLTFGRGCYCFTYKDNKFIENIRSPVMIPKESKKIYSVNEGSKNKWSKELIEYVEDFKKQEYTQRYIGSMVSDIHRTLLYGGVFIHPTKKLRLIYECFPVAFLIEAAGGKAYSKNGRILDLVPESLHQKVEIIAGCERDVKMIF